MEIQRIEKADGVFGAPSDWKDDGTSCEGLPVRLIQTDQGPFLVSAWLPTPDELAKLNAGATVKLWVRGPGHPVVALSVGAEGLPP